MLAEREEQLYASLEIEGEQMKLHVGLTEDGRAYLRVDGEGGELHILAEDVRGVKDFLRKAAELVRQSELT